MMKTFFEETNWRFIDQSLSAKTASPLESFAMDDTLCHVVGQGMSNATIRTWVHNNSVVLGIQDHRLPYILDGMNELRANGYESHCTKFRRISGCIRRGVLNISIIVRRDAAD